MSSEMLKVHSLERLIPETLSKEDATGAQTLQFHLERYEFAKRFCHTGDKILDIACGVGYGSALLQEHRAVQVLGVDIAESAIAYARQHYKGPNFICSDAMNFQSEYRFDLIVSLETIEHVPNPRALVRHLDTILKNGGIFVGSVPSSPSVDANPYHLNDFTESSFLQLFPKNYRVVEVFRQTQSFQPFRLLAGKEARASDLRKNLLGFYLRHPEKLLSRIWHTVNHGFVNHYVTVAFRKE